MAAGYAGTESDVKSLFKITPDRSDTGREIGIGLWAVSDEYTPVLHQGELCIRTVYAVRHDRRAGFAAKETKLIIGFPIERSIGA